MANRGIKGLSKARKMFTKNKQNTEKKVEPSCEEPGCGCGN
jgi:hypothetical protein|tara:strand:- start:32 stop:154 length:123 start_codon:yes stop_codon:yes gene_type:complete